VPAKRSRRPRAILIEDNNEEKSYSEQDILVDNFRKEYFGGVEQIAGRAINEALNEAKMMPDSMAITFKKGELRVVFR